MYETIIYLTQFFWHLLKFWAKGGFLTSLTLILVLSLVDLGFGCRSDGLGEQYADQRNGAGEILLVLAPAFANTHSLLRKCSGKISRPLFPTPYSVLPKGARLAKLISEGKPIVLYFISIFSEVNTLPCLLLVGEGLFAFSSYCQHSRDSSGPAKLFCILYSVSYEVCER